MVQGRLTASHSEKTDDFFRRVREVSPRMCFHLMAGLQLLPGWYKRGHVTVKEPKCLKS
jgi:predicted RNase H-like nuclease